ncbi:MAG: hypothetical protein ABFD50_18565 [Smithella sp.]
MLKKRIWIVLICFLFLQIIVIYSASSVWAKEQVPQGKILLSSSIGEAVDEVVNEVIFDDVIEEVFDLKETYAAIAHSSSTGKIAFSFKKENLELSELEFHRNLDLVK